jgi:hypothetical protein
MIFTLRRNPTIWAVLLLIVFLTRAEAEDRVQQAADLIIKLCIAGGSQSVEIRKKGTNIEVAGMGDSLLIDRRESSGLVGGISKEITALSAQQASEARSCTQKYLKQLVDIILQDDARNTSRGSDEAPAPGVTVFSDPAAFWGRRGFWQDTQNFCGVLVGFLSGSSTPSGFKYLDTGEPVSLSTVNREGKKIEGNFFVRTEPGSRAHFCHVYDNRSGGGYFALTCTRLVSIGNSGVFASVYNQTLKDMRDCLLPEGWKQVSVEQGACIPVGSTAGECVRIFRKGSRHVWLFSNYQPDQSRYTMGIQTRLGD